jgi:predicted ATPase
VYGRRAAEIAAELAMHFEECADYLQAAHYLHQAARNAMSRWAYGEAIALSRHGLRLLAALPDDDERARRDLALRITLGVPLIATEGYASPEVGEVYRDARALGHRLGARSELSQVLWGLWTFHAVKGELATAWAVAEELLTLARDGDDPELAMRGHWAMEITCTHRGQFERALGHFDTALQLIAAMRERDERPADALHPGVATRCFAAWSFWFAGRVDTAVRTVNEALALARRMADPHGLSHALVFAAVLYQLRREPVLARQHAEAAIALSSEHRLPLYEGMGQVVRGWAMSAGQDPAGALAEIRRGLARWEGTNARVMKPYFLGLAAEGSAAAAREAQAVEQIDEALACSAASGERFYDAELHRLKGAYLLRLTPSNNAAAVACFEQAAAIAREQQARSLELRIAMSLATLDRRVSPPDRTALHAVFARFTEGFDTPDLRDAALLLGAAAS